MIIIQIMLVLSLFNIENYVCVFFYFYFMNEKDHNHQKVDYNMRICNFVFFIFKCLQNLNNNMDMYEK